MRLVYRLVLLVLILVLTILFWTQSDQTDRSGLDQSRNEPIKLKNHLEDDDFDRRQRKRKELKDEINSNLIKLIKHGKFNSYTTSAYAIILPTTHIFKIRHVQKILIVHHSFFWKLVAIMLSMEKYLVFLANLSKRLKLTLNLKVQLNLHPQSQMYRQWHHN